MRPDSVLLLCAALLLCALPAHRALPRLGTRGTQSVDGYGNQAILRGCNLGT